MPAIPAPRRVSVLGFGLMGSALAEAFLNAGHEVTVWNRSVARVAPLTKKGARAAASAGAALAASDVTIICVTNHAATMEILNGVSDSGSGMLVQLSTMTPDESQELAAWAKAGHMPYLDGSILGLPANVVERVAMVIFSGPADIFEANRALFQALGSPMHLSPEIGASMTFDRAWYAYSYSVMMAFVQGAALAQTLGFSLDVYFQTVKTRTPAFIDAMMNMGEKIAARDYATDDARIDIWADGIKGTLALCRDKGVDDGLPAAVLANLQRASAAGHGDSDLAAVFETLIKGTGK